MKSIYPLCFTIQCEHDAATRQSYRSIFLQYGSLLVFKKARILHLAALATLASNDIFTAGIEREIDLFSRHLN
jgi:hypothetical protein